MSCGHQTAILWLSYCLGPIIVVHLGVLLSQSQLEDQVSQFRSLATIDQPVREGVTSPADPPAGPSQTDIVALALDNALNSSGDNAAVSHIQNSLIPIGEGLPAIPRNLLQKIRVNDYIDFTELPSAKGSPRSKPHLMEGRVLLVQWQELENHMKAISDFATWAQCYAVYTAVILQCQPHRAADLMAYLVKTANNSKRYCWPSWLVYDQNCHQRMAGRKGEVWAKTDPGIYFHQVLHGPT